MSESRRRSARNLPRTPIVPANTTTPGQSRLLTTQNDHSSRFVALPTEILHEIANSFPQDTIPFKRIQWPLSPEDEFAQTRGRLVRTLCAVSRVLRQTFWSCMWRNIEVLTSQYANDEKYANRIGRWEVDMVRKLSLLFDIASENPALANQVETLNILICSPSCNRGILSAIAHNLSLFPNLNSFQLHAGDRTSYFVEKRLYKSFLKYKFLSIRKLVLVAEQIVIAGSCPNLEELHILSYIPPIRRHLQVCETWWLEPPLPAKSIESLCVHYGALRTKEIIAAMPNLKVLEFYETRLLPDACSALLCLRSHPRLTRFRISLFNVTGDFALSLQQKTEKVLSQLPPRIQCEVRVIGN